MRYHEGLGLLVVVYASGNIDLYNGHQVYNLSDIYRKAIIGRKQINHVLLQDEFAYIATSFGIVKMDLKKRETVDFYNNIGANGSLTEVFSTTIRNDTLFAATGEGIKYGSTKSNLADFQNWSLMLPASYCPVVTQLNGVLMAAVDSTIQVFDGTSWTSVMGNGHHAFYTAEVSGNNMVFTGADSIWVTTTNQRHSSGACLCSQSGPAVAKW
jgi:hypothetical protein